MLSLEMQPGAPVAVPERGGSLPPLHLHPSRPVHDVSPPGHSSAVTMDPRAPKAFPWTRLPSHTQQQILSWAILPDGPDTTLIIGDSDHSKHIQKVAVPVLLGLGSSSGYHGAMSVLYRDVHLDLCVHRRSSVIFLTSVHALRPRNMVVRLLMVLDIKKSLPLFDTGHTIRQSKGKLIKVNVPTALRCMKVHGRLSEVEFLIDRLGAAGDLNVPEDYLPLAEIQLVNGRVLQMWDDYTASSSVGKRPETRQEETVIAPAFLACRAWQSGFLPLFEDGIFQKGATLALMPNRDEQDRRRAGGEGIGSTIFRVEGASLMRYWLGGTIVELLDETVHPTSWIDPFTLSTPQTDGGDGVYSSVEDRHSDTWPHEDVVVFSIESLNNAPPSPGKATDSSSDSGSASGDTGCQEQCVAANRQKRMHDSRLGYSTSDDGPGPFKGASTPSDDGSLSDEVGTRKLHQRFGIGSRARENTFPVSPSSSESPAHSTLIDGTASFSSDSEPEAC